MGPRGAAGPPGKNGEDVSNPYHFYILVYDDVRTFFFTSMVNTV